MTLLDRFSDLDLESLGHLDGVQIVRCGRNRILVGTKLTSRHITVPEDKVLAKEVFRSTAKAVAREHYEMREEGIFSSLEIA